jgi:hypothetical protein
MGYTQPTLFELAAERYVSGLAQRRAAEDREVAPPAPERGLHRHSLEAREHRDGEFKGRKALILDVLRMAQKPMTDRQIKERLFGENADMNMVRPRVNDLIQEGKVRECFEVEDHLTGEKVRTVWMGYGIGQ